MRRSYLVRDAEHLQQILRERFPHVKVCCERGNIVIYPTEAAEEEKLAKLTVLDNQKYGLSFYRSNRRWEPMPFSGNIVELAVVIKDTLAPYLEEH